MEKDIILFSVFHAIPLDIEGSNLSNTGWLPSEKDKSFMGQDSYDAAIEEHNLANEKVLFKNVSLQWDSCDCGDGYGCSHGSFVYEISIFSGGKNIDIDITDGDSLEFYNEGNYCKIPIVGATVFDFIRMCQICEIELEFSDYANSLISNFNHPERG